MRRSRSGASENILERGTAAFSKHALEALTKDDLITVDCANVLRGGVVQPGELE
jgi:hypothetical protein